MQNTKSISFGWIILPILAILPAFFWIFQSPLLARFSSLQSTALSVGDMAGLTGMAMFSLVIILSARLKFFEKFFRGINELYIVHHFLGGLAFCLLLLHPLFLAYNYLSISFKSAALFLLPSQNLAQNLGILGLFVMIIALIITFYFKIKYQIWKFTHKFMGLAFIFSFFHTFLIGADIAENFWLKLYLLILSILAIAAYFYRAIFAGFFVKTFDYKIKNIKTQNDKIWEITLEAQNEPINFSPGQFAFFKFFSDSLSKEIHPFSLCSATGNPLKIAIKELGDWTNKIGNLKAGDLVKIEGPFGIFSYKNFENKKQVWVAGGAGITPFLGMLRSLTEKDFDYRIDLYYSAKDENAFAFRQEITEISAKNKNVRMLFWATDKNGLINADSIKQKTLDLNERDILICGPPIMMGSLKKQFLGQGIEINKIHTEEFRLY